MENGGGAPLAEDMSVEPLVPRTQSPRSNHVFSHFIFGFRNASANH